MNWLIIDGLKRYGFKDHATALTETTLEMVNKSGCAEYFDPFTGEAAGSPNFSWTAALVIDLLKTKKYMSYLPLHSHYHLLRMREMGRIYWCHSLAAIGSYLILIFVPIFLLKIGYRFREVLSISCCSNSVVSSLQYPVARLFKYLRQSFIGNRPAMFRGFIWPITNSRKSALATLFTSPSLGLESYHLLGCLSLCFAEARAHKHSGRQVAGLTALSTFGATIAPAVGGIIASSLGIHYVYGAAILILVIAFLPLIAKVEGPPKTGFHISRGEILSHAPRPSSQCV